MAESDAELIGGTIIQRSFVGTGVASVMNVASVPIKEIADDTDDIQSDDFLRVLTAELLGVPSRSLIDETQYFRLSEFLLDYPISHYVRWGLGWPEEILLNEWHTVMRRASAPRPTEGRLVGFAKDVISLCVSSQQPSVPWSLGVLPVSQRFLAGVASQLQGSDADSDTLLTGLACLGAKANQPPKVRDYASALLRYDIPLGQSPATKSDSLLKLLESGRKMCLAPLAAGGTLGIGQLGQGQFVAALLSTGTGAAMTLILLGTIAVGSILVTRVAQKRAKSRRRKDRRDEPERAS